MRRTLWKFNDLSVSDIRLWDYLQAGVWGKESKPVGRLRPGSGAWNVGSVCGVANPALWAQAHFDTRCQALRSGV
jgi:hypothetical protein